MGDATLVVTKSDCVAVETTSAATAVLFAEFGSATEEVTLAVSLICVPAAVPELTLTTYVIVAGDAATSAEFVQVSVATLQLQPVGPVSDTAVVFAGKVSVSVTPVAVLGPAFETCWV